MFKTRGTNLWYALGLSFETPLQGVAMPQNDEKNDALTFELTAEQTAALRAVAGSKGIRISGYVDGNLVKVDSIAINAGIVGIASAPFAEGMAPFIACNGPMRREEKEK
jgi:hypothetical protein